MAEGILQAVFPAAVQAQLYAGRRQGRLRVRQPARGPAPARGGRAGGVYGVLAVEESWYQVDILCLLDFLYEKYAEIIKDQYGNEKETIWLLKDTVGNQYYCADAGVVPMIPMMAKNNLLCYLMDTSRFEYLDEMKRTGTGFAEKIDIINMNNIPMKNTIEVLKRKGGFRRRLLIL